MSEARPYYAPEGASAVHYDLITAADPSLDGDIDLYAAQAPPGGSILELGTGTGRVAIALAERGFDVTGVDIAPTMLAQAQARHALLPPDVAARLQLLRADMCSLALGTQFDAVIATFYTLSHVQPSTVWKQLFIRIARHLKPGGRFAAHLATGANTAGQTPPPGTVMLRRQTAEGDTLSLLFVERQITDRTGRQDLILDYVLTSPTGAILRSNRERLTLFDADPVPFAQRAGLHPIGEPTPFGPGGAVHLFEKR